MKNTFSILRWLPCCRTSLSPGPDKAEVEQMRQIQCQPQISNPAADYDPARSRNRNVWIGPGSPDRYALADPAGCPDSTYASVQQRSSVSPDTSELFVIPMERAS